MLKNNKGITLISVVITVIIMMTILTSIIYSNNNSNELKEEMLLNSDIEQLNKKVKLYYLKNKTLPIDENVYCTKTFNVESEEIELMFYKLNISSLENLNLKNLEKDNQYYVINKETHLIYFVIDGGIQEGKYSEKYSDIVKKAYINAIEFDAKTNIDVGEEIVEEGIQIVKGREYSSYIGWNYSGTRTKNLVLQYDGQYNAIDEDGNPTTNTAATTWADLTKNGNDGEIVTGILKYSVSINDAKVGGKYKPYGQGFLERSSGTYSWENKGLALLNNTFIAVTCGNTKPIITTNTKSLYNGDDEEGVEQEYEPKNILPTGNNAQYTMEIVFDYVNNGSNRGLIGSGRYSDYSAENKRDWGLKMSNITTNRKFKIIQDEYHKKFNYLPFNDDEGDSFKKSDFNGQSNVLKINSETNEIVSNYYYKDGTVLGTGEMSLTEGTHTATVLYDGTNTKIYIDGAHAISLNLVPNLQDEVEFTIGATNRKMDVDIVSGTSTNKGEIHYAFDYTEFLNDTVYSVRIYDRALNDKEIEYNYNIDASRFISQ